MRWAGWSDALAGIKLYEVEVYKMKAFGNKLTHTGETALVRETLDANTLVYNTTLVDPGKHELNTLISLFYVVKLYVVLRVFIKT